MNIDKLIGIFVDIDDFCILFQPEILKIRLKSPQKVFRRRKSRLSDIEMMTILIAFHLSHYTNFKAFYKEYICVHWTVCHIKREKQHKVLQ